MSRLGRSSLRWGRAARPAPTRRRRRELEPLEKRLVLSVSPVGDEVAVTPPLDDVFQVTSFGRSMAADNDGDFVVVWEQFSFNDPSVGSDVYAQVIDRNGTPLTPAPVRVNTTVPGDQFAPVVAMDADGEFVVSWTGPGYESGTLLDVYARRFSSTGQPLADEFRVNSNINNPQFQPAIGMDADGNFTIAWATSGQDVSFFNNVRAKRFDRVGNPLGSEFGVNVDNANEHILPDVAVSPEGDRLLISWTHLLPEGPGPVAEPTVRAILYDAVTGAALTEDFIVDSGRNSTADFDTEGNFIIAYDTLRNNDFGLPDPPPRTFDQRARIYTRDGVFIPAFGQENLFINEVERNAPSRAVPELQLWPYGDFRGLGTFSGVGTGNPSISLDADFDFIATYEGMGAQLFPDDDGYGINQSVWAAAPGTADRPTIFDALFSDDYVNTTLDGQSAIWEIKFSDDTTGGSFEVGYLYGGALGPDDPVSIQLGETPDETAENINEALEALIFTGINEDENLVNSVLVQVVDPFTFNVFFVDSLHAAGVELFMGDSELTTDVEGVEGSFTVTLVQEGFMGSIQSRATVAMEPDGDYVIAWTGYNMDDPSPAGYLLDTTIYYRRFDESTDTAGPRITDIVVPADGNRIEEGEVLPAAVTSLTVTFDEEMRLSTVLDVENYKIVRNGDEELIGTIAQALNFRLNPATNKWEVTLLLDGNGPDPGVTPLEEGFYEIVGTNRLRDKSGNPLKLTGYNTNGESFSRQFAIQVPAGSEARANSTTVGNQYTEKEATQPVASDADGDFVIVWVSDGQDGSGAGVYGQLFNADGSKRGNEFRVNTTTAGDQRHANVAMDADGDFVVTWSQFTSATNWDVYAQRFASSGAPVGREFLVNSTTTSIQRYSSVAMDVDGDFIIAWQSFNQDGSGYGVYSQRYNNAGSRRDGVDEVQVITFGGSPTGGTFTLTFNGQTTQPVLYTPQSGGDVTAAELEVALRQFADVRVTALNSLQFQVSFTGADGSLNVSALEVGQNNTGASSILITTEVQGVTGETLVNDTTLNNQRFPTVDMDSVGNYIISWTSSGQDGDEPFEQNIYAKRFVNLDSGETPPNPGPGTVFNLIDPPNTWKWGPSVLGSGATITYAFMATGIQDTQGIDGNWTNTAISEFMPAGAEDEIRRAFADWAAVANLNFVEVTDGGEEFGVLNANSADIRIGGHPISEEDVLGHAYGPAAPGADGRTGDVHFDSDRTWQIGTGGPGFDIWNTAIHEIGHALGLGHIELAGQVMQPAGPDQLDLGSGDILGAQYLYGIRGNAIGGEFRVNQTTENDQRWSSVGVDADGDFVIAWTSYGQDGAGNGYGPGFNGVDGIVARRYDRFGSPVGDEFLVNQFRDNEQRYPRVAMDADGDFAIVWQSYQDRSFPADAPDSYGVYAKVFRPAAVNAGPNGEFGSEFRVNTSIDGDQVGPGVASTNDGRLIVAWSGFGDRPTHSDPQGVFFQRFNSTGSDDTPPTVGGVNAVGALRLVVTFSEDMLTDGGASGLNSVLNESLWALLQAGNPLSDPIANIQFGLSEAFAAGLSTSPSNKWEAVVTLNSPLLLQTDYTLRIDDSVYDLAGNSLDGDFDGMAGGDYTKVFQVSADSAVGAVGNQFLVNVTQSATQDDSATAVNAAGDFVVVWSSATTPGVNGDVRGQRYNSQGVAQGAEFTAHPSTTGNQDSPDVAMDALGNYVVVWSGAGAEDVEGIYARRFDSLGNALDAQPVFVNLGSVNLNEAQLTPAVARTSTGAFVVTWVTKTTAGDQGDVMMRVYSAAGTPLIGETRVNTTTSGRQYAPDVAVNSLGDFVVTWTSDGQDGDQGGIYARRYSSAGVAQGAEFRVNQTTAQSQTNSVVGLADTGFFTIAWTSNLQDGNGLGVYLQRFNSAGVALEPADVRVNQFTAGAQSEPALASDSAGNFVITWSSANQDTSGLGVFARVFSSAGVDAFGGEFLVNTTIAGDQRRPALAGNDDGDVIITWTSPDTSSTGIYAQRYRFAPSMAPPDALPGIAAVRVKHSGNNGNIYQIPVGSGEQLRTVDVGRVDQIQIAFSENVIVTQADLTIQGVVQANYAPTAFSYDSLTHVATWTLPIIFNDRITITLSQLVRDATGNALDGEWENPTSLTDPSASMVSGDGQGGGDFVFKFTVLSADGNRDNKITGADYTIWANGFGLFTGDATVRDGDFNGDGFITGADYTLWANQFGLDYSNPPSLTPPDRKTAGVALDLMKLDPQGPAQVELPTLTLGRVTTGVRAQAHDAALAVSRPTVDAPAPAVESRAVDEVLGGDRDVDLLDELLAELAAA